MLTPKSLNSVLRSSAINPLFAAFLCVWCSPSLPCCNAPSPLEPKQHSCQSRNSASLRENQLSRGVYRNCSAWSALLQYAPPSSFAPQDVAAFRDPLDYNAGATHRDSAAGSSAYSKAELQGLQVMTYGKWRVWRNKDLMIFVSGLSVDADGSPHAYHPDNVSGLDDLAHAGRPGGWVGLATVDGAPDGAPIVQGEADPAPSFYVSSTALEDEDYPASSPNHYIDAEKVPYIALPIDLEGPELGDLGYVFNLRNCFASAAIVADESPRLGEGSIALAKALGINADARHGGADSGVLFVIFLNSGSQSPLPVSEIDAQVNQLRHELRLDELLNGIAVSESELHPLAAGELH